MCRSRVSKVCSPLQGLVVAGLADMTRPAEKLSTSQSGVLTATGDVTLNCLININHACRLAVECHRIPMKIQCDAFLCHHGWLILDMSS